ncbi:phosphotransferase [Arthrobacter sp. UYCo732]|uniref:phosphotransferase family protein n=1 Tax=Arthrobacter sp. UYCo732 TaxID=3156336 RepID=UPI003394A2A3
MTTLHAVRPAVRSWSHLRSPGFNDLAPEVVAASVPDGLSVESVAHLRTAHYAVYKAFTDDGSYWVVRIGLVSEEDDAPADNTGFQGTSMFSPSGQRREFDIARGYAAAGAGISIPSHYDRAERLDVLWVPFLTGDARPLTAAQWHQALTELQAYRPAEEMPVFTNRTKSFARLDELPDQLTVALRNRYDTAMEALFEAATSWSVVHGDAHAGNAVNVGGRAVLFDFDTACWAPSVWDLTHLLNRAGVGPNTGYAAAELAALFSFTAAEVAAALELRKIAAGIARIHREHAAQAGAPGPVRAAA